MDADEARHDRLIEIATKAHQHRVATNLTRAVHSSYSKDEPTQHEIAQIKFSEAACAAADKALSEWRERHAR
jgi:hypothetical protein